MACPLLLQAGTLTFNAASDAIVCHAGCIAAVKEPGDMGGILRLAGR